MSQGHNQGEIEAINLLITSYGVYLLKRRELMGDSGGSSANEKSSTDSSPTKTNKYIKLSYISHNQMDYVEVSLCDQSIHFVCINKRQNCWITVGSRKLTE